MGACDFEDFGYGKNVGEVFARCRDDAAWEHGHGGYTGTIAEKHDYVLIDLPPRVTTRKARSMWFQYSNLQSAKEAIKELQDPNCWMYKRFGTKADRSKALTQAKRQLRAAEKELGKHVDLARRIYQIADDKWGPAVAVELKGKELKDWRQRMGLQGRRGIRAFVFFGLASS